ncbi:MAG: hypothetical protein Q9227_006025 [Pyrenula ochraceoflavens]
MPGKPRQSQSWWPDADGESKSETPQKTNPSRKQTTVKGRRQGRKREPGHVFTELEEDRPWLWYPACEITKQRDRYYREKLEAHEKQRSAERLANLYRRGWARERGQGHGDTGNKPRNVKKMRFPGPNILFPRTMRPITQPCLDLIRPVLFPSSSRDPATTTTAPLPFLQLPGELRNQIYDLVFANRRVIIKKRRRTVEEVNSNDSFAYTGLVHIQIIGRKRYDSVSKTNPFPFALVRICKQVYNEALPYMYANTRFWLGSQKPIHRFLETVPLKALGYIKHLELYHSGYGEPSLTEHCKFKDRGDKSWTNLCLELSNKLLGLKTLRLDYCIRDWPTQITLDSDWAQPILEFGAGRFDEVEMRLFHNRFDDEDLQLKLCANAAVKHLLNDTGKQQLVIRKALEKKRQEEAREFYKWLEDWELTSTEALSVAAKDDQEAAEESFRRAKIDYIHQTNRVKSLRIMDSKSSSSYTPKKYNGTFKGFYLHEGGVGGPAQALGGLR